ncbi:hypothetical protein GCM10022406_21900 [Hymenobacter algoricola]|uniref:DUF4476 domain-containing protein n=1 Tax=Hymenobacter algoricola TaxID=486267 RepID=A0ABP7N586_9BACT
MALAAYEGRRAALTNATIAMKKALLLSFSLLLAFGLRAAPANVTFTSERGTPFRLIFDGRPLTRGAARQVHIDRLRPGYHTAEFMIPTGYGRFHTFRTRVFLDPGLETSFVLITRPGYAPLLRKVAAAVLHPGYGAPGYDDNYPNGGYQNGQDGYNDNDDYRGNDDRGGYDGQDNGNPGGDDSGRDDGRYGSQYPGGGSGRYRAMSPQDVEVLAQTLKRNSFDSNRLSIAKQALDQTYIQADDLKRLLAGFDFEASRVELAKYAYPRVADRQNFYRVYDAFDFQSSVQEVQRAVGGPR